MDTQKFLTLGTVGALACVGACAAAALIPAVLATSGVAFLTSELIGWPAAVGAALFVAAGALVWRARSRRAKQGACGCGNAETGQ